MTEAPPRRLPLEVIHRALFDRAWSRAFLDIYVNLLDELASTPNAPLETGS